MLGLISVVGTTFRKCCAYDDRVPPNPMAFLPDVARLRRDLDIPQGLSTNTNNNTSPETLENHQALR